jgi:hypothetical protein
MKIHYRGNGPMSSFAIAEGRWPMQRRYSPMRRAEEFDELHLLFAARARPVAAKGISIFRVGFRPSTCSAIRFYMVNRIAAWAAMPLEKISHAVLLIGGNVAGRRLDRRIVRHIGILSCHLDVTGLHMHYDKRAVGTAAHIWLIHCFHKGLFAALAFCQ